MVATRGRTSIPGDPAVSSAPRRTALAMMDGLAFLSVAKWFGSLTGQQKMSGCWTIAENRDVVPHLGAPTMKKLGTTRADGAGASRGTALAKLRRSVSEAGSIRWAAMKPHSRTTSLSKCPITGVLSGMGLMGRKRHEMPTRRASWQGRKRRPPVAIRPSSAHSDPHK